MTSGVELYHLCTAGNIFSRQENSSHSDGGPGGGYDAYARLIAAHVSKQIPGSPTVVVDNVTGAGA